MHEKAAASTVAMDDTARRWQPFATAPTDGTRFDAWCVHPETGGLGARLTDVQMRGDRSGFGFIVHLPDSVKWQYLDARDGGIFPEWKPTHWMPRPNSPEQQAAEERNGCRVKAGGSGGWLCVSRDRMRELIEGDPDDVEDQLVIGAPAARPASTVMTEEELLIALGRIADGMSVDDLRSIASRAIARIASSAPLSRG